MKQNDSTSCGIVAIQNALIWSNSNIQEITESKDGMTCSEMTKLLKKHTHLYLHIVKPTLKNIETHLQLQGSIILAYKPIREEYPHFIFISSLDEGGLFNVVNDRKYSITSTVSREKMREYITEYNTSGTDQEYLDTTFPQAWLLKNGHGY